jgi:hypothetical protein
MDRCLCCKFSAEPQSECLYPPDVWYLGRDDTHTTSSLSYSLQTVVVVSSQSSRGGQSRQEAATGVRPASPFAPTDRPPLHQLVACPFATRREQLPPPTSPNFYDDTPTPRQSRGSLYQFISTTSPLTFSRYRLRSRHHVFGTSSTTTSLKLQTSPQSRCFEPVGLIMC